MYKCANITYSSEYLSEYLTLNNYTRLFSHLLQRLVAYCEMLFHYSFYKRSSSDNSTWRLQTTSFICNFQKDKLVKTQSMYVALCRTTLSQLN